MPPLVLITKPGMYRDPDGTIIPYKRDYALILRNRPPSQLGGSAQEALRLMASFSLGAGQWAGANLAAIRGAIALARTNHTKWEDEVDRRDRWLDRNDFFKSLDVWAMCLCLLILLGLAIGYYGFDGHYIFGLSASPRWHAQMGGSLIGLTMVGVAVLWWLNHRKSPTINQNLRSTLIEQRSDPLGFVLEGLRDLFVENLVTLETFSDPDSFRDLGVSVPTSGDPNDPLTLEHGMVFFLSKRLLDEDLPSMALLEPLIKHAATSGH